MPKLMIIFDLFKNYKISLQYLLAIIILIAPLNIFLSSLSIYITIFLILLWHLLISLPLLKMLSTKCQWELIAETSSNLSFKHPYFILTISTGIIYPLIWGLFLSLSRYFRLGNTINISSFLIGYIDYLILCIFILPYIILWFYLIFTTLSEIREALWEYTISLTFSIHLQALQYYDYFRICQIIHKSHFMISFFNIQGYIIDVFLILIKFLIL